MLQASSRAAADAESMQRFAKELTRRWEIAVCLINPAADTVTTEF
jgi:hypothetical protein